ncbi:MAG: hypothetical protein H6696_14435 [Deferribacteres bacterium]|nr:hypothetical protein [candidate division KSB1 bacterium]MCB9503125.1 hypothetical protein [Deferribacteres bacterium]
MAEKKKSNLEQLLAQNNNLARKIVEKTHLDFDVLYAIAHDTLKGEKRIHAEAHLATCPTCKETLAELKDAADFIESYDPKPVREEMPERVRNAIPVVKPANANVLASLVFSKDKILEKIKGLVDDIDDFIVQTLEPDAGFIANTRSRAKKVLDYKINYRGIELVISTNSDQESVEIYAKTSDPRQVDRLNIQLISQDDKSSMKSNRFVVGEFIKFVFSDIDLDSTTYELQITTNPPIK